jgi:hypothetical protein
LSNIYANSAQQLEAAASADPQLRYMQEHQELVAAMSKHFLFCADDYGGCKYEKLVQTKLAAA